MADLSNLEWKGVESSNIGAIALADGKLYVRFVNGNVYSYDDGAHQEHESLFQRLSEAADTPGKSVGSTFFALVRRPEIPATKLGKMEES